MQIRWRSSGPSLHCEIRSCESEAAGLASMLVELKTPRRTQMAKRPQNAEFRAAVKTFCSWDIPACCSTLEVKSKLHPNSTE